MNATEVRAALRQRYFKPTAAQSEQYVCIEEARSGAGFDGNAGQCDFLAINTWKGRGMELIGHEVKVSIADWRAELANQEKADRFAKYCRRWFVVVPSELAKKMRDEVPPAWGLLSVADSGRCTQLQAAPVVKAPEPVPAWWWIGWLAQTDREHKRDVTRELGRLLDAERAKLEERIHADAERDREHRERAARELSEKVTEFRKATGIDVRHLWAHQTTKLQKAWALVQSGYDVTTLTRMLRDTADSLDGLIETEEAG